jgi:hypothetical protein
MIFEQKCMIFKILFNPEFSAAHALDSRNRQFWCVSLIWRINRHWQTSSWVQIFFWICYKINFLWSKKLSFLGAQKQKIYSLSTKYVHNHLQVERRLWHPTSALKRRFVCFLFVWDYAGSYSISNTFFYIIKIWPKNEDFRNHSSSSYWSRETISIAENDSYMLLFHLKQHKWFFSSYSPSKLL